MNALYVIVVEHDLSILDYMSDFICVLYGTPGAYGVVTFPSGVREGINDFLEGFIPSENLRFRDSALKFRVGENAENVDEDVKKLCAYSYPQLTKTLGDFELTMKEGDFTDSEIIVILGENGTGKTTFVRLLAGSIAPDDEEDAENMPKLNVSYKPQKVSPSFPGTVRQLLHAKICKAYIHPQFIADVIKPMQIPQIMDREVKNLSGGEIQRVALTLCLGKPADVYLIDEPSAYRKCWKSL